MTLYTVLIHDQSYNNISTPTSWPPANTCYLLFCRRFSFCLYPFILSMSAKKTILQQDSEHQMLIMAKVRLWNQRLTRDPLTILISTCHFIHCRKAWLRRFSRTRLLRQRPSSSTWMSEEITLWRTQSMKWEAL